jgi:hypothetical protein
MVHYSIRHPSGKAAQPVFDGFAMADCSWLFGRLGGFLAGVAFFAGASDGATSGVCGATGVAAADVSILAGLAFSEAGITFSPTGSVAGLPATSAGTCSTTLTPSETLLARLPVLYNTSFNPFGDPLMCTPRDAVRSFYSSGIDALFVGNFILEK